MTKSKFLLPLDGTEKSLNSINWFKKLFSSEEAEVTLMNVLEFYYRPDITAFDDISYETSRDGSARYLDRAEKMLEGYEVNKLIIGGASADEILKEAESGRYDMIIMTKSSAKGITKFIGSVTSKVVRNSSVAVIVIPE